MPIETDQAIHAKPRAPAAVCRPNVILANAMAREADSAATLHIAKALDKTARSQEVSRGEAWNAPHRNDWANRPL